MTQSRSNLEDDLIAAIKEERVDKVNELLKNGVNAKLIEPETGYSLLHFAAEHDSTEIIESLIRFGTDVNQADMNGVTPLMISAARGQTQSLEILLANGADPSKADNGFATAYNYAKDNGRFIIAIHLDELIEKMGKDTTNVVSNNFAQEDPYGPPALLFPAIDGEVEKVKNLLQKRHNPNLLDDENQNVLHHILYALKEADNESLARNIKAAMSILLEYKINVNQADKKGVTPLMLAAELGYTDIVKELLLNGANPDLKNSRGMTAIQYADKNNEVIEVIAEFANKYRTGEKQKSKVDFDVIISGAGAAGLATALEAVKSGLSVSIISNRSPEFLRVQRVGLTQEDADYLLNLMPKDNSLTDEDTKFKVTLESTTFVAIKDIENFLKRRLDQLANEGNKIQYQFESSLVEVDMKNGRAKIAPVKQDLPTSSVNAVSFQYLVGADGISRHALSMVNNQLEEPIRMMAQTTSLPVDHSSAYLTLSGSNVAETISALKDSRLAYFHEGYQVAIIFEKQSLNNLSQDGTKPIKCNVVVELPPDIASIVDLKERKQASIDYIKKVVDLKFPNSKGIEMEITPSSKKFGESKDKLKHTLFTTEKISQASKAGEKINDTYFLLAGDAFRTPHYHTGMGMGHALEQARKLGELFERKIDLPQYNEFCKQLGAEAGTRLREISKDSEIARTNRYNT